MLVKPDQIVPHVCEIDLAHLEALGVRGFIFDLDNTLMAPRAGHLDEKVATWLDAIQLKGFQVIVVSNNPRTYYTDAAAQHMNIPVLGNAGKPSRRQLRKAVEQLGLEAHQVAVVGDRPLTDILGGQRLGARTILVDPLIKHQEPRLFKILRALEGLCVNRFHAKK